MEHCERNHRPASGHFHEEARQTAFGPAQEFGRRNGRTVLATRVLCKWTSKYSRCLEYLRLEIQLCEDSKAPWSFVYLGTNTRWSPCRWLRVLVACAEAMCAAPNCRPLLQCNSYSIDILKACGDTVACLAYVGTACPALHDILVV
jgi:hypothetical protein